jgi:hypothetical protein
MDIDGLAEPAQINLTTSMPFKKLFVPIASIVGVVWAAALFDKSVNQFEAALAKA